MSPNLKRKTILMALIILIFLSILNVKAENSINSEQKQKSIASVSPMVVSSMNSDYNESLLLETKELRTEIDTLRNGLLFILLITILTLIFLIFIGLYIYKKFENMTDKIELLEISSRYSIKKE